MGKTAQPPAQRRQVPSPAPKRRIYRRFFCLQARLVVEVDGGQHGGPPECGATLSMTDLPLEWVPHPGQDTQFVVRLGSTVHEVERELIVRTIEHAGGNKTRASDILGMSRRKLYYRLHRYAALKAVGQLKGQGYRDGRNGRS